MPLAMLAFGTVGLCDTAGVLHVPVAEIEARGRESIGLGDRLASVDPYLKLLGPIPLGDRLATVGPYLKLLEPIPLGDPLATVGPYPTLWVPTLSSPRQIVPSAPVVSHSRNWFPSSGFTPRIRHR